MTTPLLAITIAALLATVAANIPDASRFAWLKPFLIVVAIVFAAVFIVTAWDWFMHVRAERLREIEAARAYAAVMVAQAVRGLTGSQVDIVSRYGLIEVEGLLGQNQVLWTIRAPGGNIPLEYLSDFLWQSRQTRPNLWPIRKHDIFSTEEFAWKCNTEEMSARITDFLVGRDYAAPASGNNAARLLVSLEEVANVFGIDLEG